MAHAHDRPSNTAAKTDDMAFHPLSPSPVYVRFEIDLARSTLRVHIAGLADGIEYATRAQLARDSGTLLDESRSFSAPVSAATGVFTAKYSVAIPSDAFGSPLPLSFELFQDKALLAMARRNVVIAQNSAQVRFHPAPGIKVEADDLAVGKKRSRPEDLENETPKTVKKPVNRQADVLKCIMDEPVTERVILERCGDNRYTREILRRLMALESVERVGRGGANDPFRYRFLCTPEEAIQRGNVDPQVSIRMKRIEDKILALLSQHVGLVTEKEIRAVVGDNTGTGKALRHLVKTSRVARVGRGGVGDPFTYKAMDQDAAHKPTPSHEGAEQSCHMSDRSTVAPSEEEATDEETEVAQTLALLAAGRTQSNCQRPEAVSEEGKVALLLESYMAAAAVLEAQC
jgi:hypothetical protein